MLHKKKNPTQQTNKKIQRNPPPPEKSNTIVTGRKISIGARKALALLVQWKQSQPLDIRVKNKKIVDLGIDL